MSHEKDSELEDTPIESIFSLDFYEDVINLLKSFTPTLSYLRIKSEFDKLTQEKYSLDFINFIIIIIFLYYINLLMRFFNIMRFKKLPLSLDCYKCILEVFPDGYKYYKIMKKQIKKKDE